MKANIIDIATYSNEYEQKTYRVVLEFEEIPKLILGECEVKQ